MISVSTSTASRLRGGGDFCSDQILSSTERGNAGTRKLKFAIQFLTMHIDVLHIYTNMYMSNLILSCDIEMLKYNIYRMQLITTLN